jgi:hypothetical protein
MQSYGFTAQSFIFSTRYPIHVESQLGKVSVTSYYSADSEFYLHSVLYQYYQWFSYIRFITTVTAFLRWVCYHPLHFAEDLCSGNRFTT